MVDTEKIHLIIRLISVIITCSGGSHGYHSVTKMSHANHHRFDYQEYFDYARIHDEEEKKFNIDLQNNAEDMSFQDNEDVLEEIRFDDPSAGNKQYDDHNNGEVKSPVQDDRNETTDSSGKNLHKDDLEESEEEYFPDRENDLNSGNFQDSELVMGGENFPAGEPDELHQNSAIVVGDDQLLDHDEGCSNGIKKFTAEIISPYEVVIKFGIAPCILKEISNVKYSITFNPTTASFIGGATGSLAEICNETLCQITASDPLYIGPCVEYNTDLQLINWGGNTPVKSTAVQYIKMPEIGPSGMIVFVDESRPTLVKLSWTYDNNQCQTPDLVLRCLPLSGGTSIKQVCNGSTDQDKSFCHLNNLKPSTRYKCTAVLENLIGKSNPKYYWFQTTAK